VKLSNSHFDPALPYWQDYLPYLHKLAGPNFPSCSQLNALLPDGLNSGDRQPVCFVASDQLDDDNYEHRIHTTGQVSTRPHSWHDVFNALVWMRFPLIKTAMNRLHYQAGAKLKCGSRGQLRDALTLFDECGVIVFSDRLELLKALAERRWSAAFLSDDFRASVLLSICGHAMLEKYLSPYKSMTAKALLVQVDVNHMTLSREKLLTYLDQQIAKQLLAENILTKPACLAPLPLAGIPGWWPYDEQDDEFYADQQVFRLPPAQFTPAPVINF
jgi:hypothetical protein